MEGTAGANSRVRRQGGSNQEVRGLEGGLCLELGGEEERRKVEVGLDPADSSGTVGSPEAVVVVLVVPSRGQRAWELGGAEAGSQSPCRGEHLPRTLASSGSFLFLSNLSHP